MRDQIVSEGLKAAPPVTVTGAILAGMTLNQMVAVATLVYIVLQIVVLVRREIRNSRRDAAPEKDLP